MKIIIDAMGGDNAPLEIVKGALQAQKRFGADIVLTGDEAAIREAARACGFSELPDGVAPDATRVVSSAYGLSWVFLDFGRVRLVPGSTISIESIVASCFVCR